MQKYKNLKRLKAEQFCRLTSVKRETFQVMAEILSKAEVEKRSRGGPKPKLCIEDRLLPALEYLREYRTYFHVGTNYGLSESQAQRTHWWVEKELMKDKRFHLPGRKKLLENNCEFEVILIDAAESPVERPKKKEM